MMRIKINLTKVKTDLKLILKSTKKTTTKSLKCMKISTRDGNNHLTINLHFLESITFMRWILPFSKGYSRVVLKRYQTPHI